MPNSKTTEGQKPEAASVDPPVLIAERDITDLERAKLRVECLKCAIQLRTVQKPVASTIAEAQEFEAYVMGHQDTPGSEGETN